MMMIGANGRLNEPRDQGIDLQCSGILGNRQTNQDRVSFGECMTNDTGSQCKNSLSFSVNGSGFNA